MTPAQSAAFSAANGGWSAANLSILIGSIFVVLVFIWGAWLTVRTISAIYKGNAREIDFVWVGLRASAVIALAMWWVNT